MFTDNFDTYVIPGESIRCTVDGFDAVATIQHDANTSPRDYDQPGWCFDTTDQLTGAESREIIAAWERDEWFYCGVVVRVYKGVLLATQALWGIECNYPFGDKDSRNAYLADAANELLPEALAKARATLSTLVE